ncbi:cardiolipin synthase ClsB [Hydrogenophaga sp.]|uniref:cardiolipin synthase ClsB n=1 Tax=Hydrogenophaga sp. TaxID=1904254 RepID=UPI002735166F|nr:cardiolipin synthase ClsB [Hydrogenophaga sp.]MDP3348462.1 cardiolipin synthase ClsB [Hydrogenophaga sp.]MDZ4397103.1 cardiolipin synthase ClsB [Hydrogenophaga sp.]
MKGKGTSLRRSRAVHGAVRGGHQLLLLQGGAEFFPALVEAMDAARRVVHLETYIFEFAGSALSVAEALERAAQRGVVVRLVIDGVGTPAIPLDWRDRFDAAGVHWHIYAPLGGFGLLLPSRWRRLHRKLCVVDGTVGFCGGINIIDDQDDVALGRLDAPRLDFSLRVAGPLVNDMSDTMEQLWWRLQAARKARRREFKAAWEALRESRPVGDFSRLLQKLDTTRASVQGTGSDTTFGDSNAAPLGVDSARATLLLRDNVSHRHDIERAYLKAIGAARREIIIANAYFIPGRKLRRALILAAARGVRVRLLSQGKYENFFQYRAARPVYQHLVNASIEIHEYAPSAFHAKVAVVDERWATVGSTNLDPLSLLLAREANVMTTDRRFAELLRSHLDGLVQNAGDMVDVQALSSRHWTQRVLDRIAFGIMRATLFVTGHRY